MGKRILLVDDEPLILKGLKYTLEQEGYETESAMDGEEALAMFESGGFDLILLDVMLPKLDGIAVCQRIRERSDVPIIMLTAKGDDMDKILGLEYGADDYMTKPFNILEVKARIKTILRRVSGSVQQQEHRLIRVHDMEINLVKRSVTLGGKDIKLTAKEFDLLQMFVTNRGMVFSREQMLETVWKYDYAGDARTVDVHIRRLREKIERDTTKPEFIFTKWGVVDDLQVAQHVDDHEDGGEDHGSPAAGLGGPLPVQAVEEGSEERAGHGAPADAHRLGDEGHAGLGLDDGQGRGDHDEDHDQDPHDQELLLLIHLLHQLTLQQVQCDGGGGGEHQGGQRGHGRGEHQDDDHRDQERGEGFQHRGDDGGVIILDN